MIDNRSLIKKSDLLIILALTAVAAAYMFAARQTASGTVVCRVLYDGKPVKTVDLDENGTFRIPEAPLMEFEVKDGKIAAVYSGCADKVCVKTGFIGHPGQRIVCLPNKVIVSIGSPESGYANPDGPDMIAH